jgi:hypothetical protein
MPSPNMKLLLHALRLGQPQDPKAAVFVLAEEIAAHEDAIEDLRRRHAIAQTHAQHMETRANRLEAELDALRSLLSHHPVAERPQASGSQRPPSVAPVGHHSAPPPSNTPPSKPPSGGQAHMTVERLNQEDSSGDDFRVETVVVRQSDLLVVQGDAPFQISPPGAPRQGPQSSIPGAPWARDRGAQVEYPIEEYTVDSPDASDRRSTQKRAAQRPVEPGQQGRAQEDLEAETFHDAGGNDRLTITAAHPAAGAPSRAASLRTTPVMEGEERKPNPGRPPASKR